MAPKSSAPLALGTQAPSFSLPEPLTGNTVALGDYTGRPLLVMFWCNHCPYVRHLSDHVAEFAREYQDRLAIVAISANDPERYPADSPGRMAVEADRRGFVFPYLFDASQAVAQAYDAKCTPDFYLFDPAHTLAYHGRYDASRPGTGPQLSGADLRAAVDAVLAGTQPDAQQAASIGCGIKWRPGNQPS